MINAPDHIQFLERLGETLLHFLWQGAAIGILVWLVLFCLRRRSAAGRYSIALGGMLVMAAVPVVTFTALSSPLPLKERLARSAEHVPHQTSWGEEFHDRENQPRMDSGATPPEKVTLPRERTAAELPSSTTSETSDAIPISVRSAGAAFVGLPQKWPVYLSGAWLAGVLLLSLRLTASWLRIQRLTRQQVRSLPEWQHRLARLCGQMGVRSTVRLIESGLAQVPAVVGSFRPVVLMPAGALLRLTPEQVELLLLLHELAHVRRQDYLVNLMQTAVETLLFYHPAVWWLSNRIRQEREQCCDDLVVRASNLPLEYARALSAAAELATSSPPLAAASNGGDLLMRIRRLLGMSVPETRRWTDWLAGAVVLGVLAAGGIGAWLNQPAVRAGQPIADEEGPVNGRTKTERQKEGAAGEIAFPNESELTGPRVTAFGRVVDPSGEPVSGVTVYLREWSTYRFSENPYDHNPRDVFARTTTDRQGRFRFKEVPSPSFKLFDDERSRWDVVVVAEGHALAWQHLPQAENAFELLLTLVPEATLSGRIVDENGAPVASADVHALAFASLSSRIRGRQDESERLDLQRSQLSPRATTDEDGRFTLHHLSPDTRVHLVIEHEDYRREFVLAATAAQPQSDVEDVSISPDGKRTVNQRKVHLDGFTVAMQPGYRIDGHVLDERSGRAVPLAKIFLRWNQSHAAYTVADEEGRFSFTGLADRDTDYILHASQAGDNGLLPVEVPVEIPSGQRKAKLEVRLPEGQPLTGKVVAKDTGLGIPGVQVVCRVAEDENPMPSFAGSRTTTDDNGRFQFSVPPGRLALTIYGPAKDYFIPAEFVARQNRGTGLDLSPFEKTIEVRKDGPVEEVQFSVGRGLTIGGRVLDGEGKPVVGARITRPEALGGRIDERSTTSDDEGKFALSGFPSGEEQTLVATHAERRLVGKTTVKPEGSAEKETVTNVEIQLQAAARVSGKVLMEDGPLPGARVYLGREETRDGRRGLWFEANTLTNASGEYSFELVEPVGSYSVMVQRTDSDSQNSRSFSLKAGETYSVPAVEFQRLDQQVSGVVVDPKGNPVEGVVVSARNRKTGESLSVQFRMRQASITTDEQGRFTLKYLPDVPLELMAYIKPTGEDRRIRFPARIEAEPGQTDVRIVLDPKLVRGE